LGDPKQDSTARFPSLTLYASSAPTSRSASEISYCEGDDAS
jgi:hypothetical protein